MATWQHGSIGISMLASSDVAWRRDIGSAMASGKHNNSIIMSKSIRRHAGEAKHVCIVAWRIRLHGM